MHFIRDISDSIGVQGSDFNILIIVVVVTGGIWAVVRFVQDMTRPLDEDDNSSDDNHAE